MFPRTQRKNADSTTFFNQTHMKSSKKKLNEERRNTTFLPVNSAHAMLSSLQHVYLPHMLGQTGSKSYYYRTISQEHVASSVHWMSAGMLTGLRAASFLKADIGHWFIFNPSLTVQKVNFNCTSVRSFCNISVYFQHTLSMSKYSCMFFHSSFVLIRF